MAALGMSATAGRLAWAVNTGGVQDLPVREAAAIEGLTSVFVNPLRLPGASGL